MFTGPRKKVEKWHFSWIWIYPVGFLMHWVRIWTRISTISNLEPGFEQVVFGVKIFEFTNDSSFDASYQAESNDTKMHVWLILKENMTQ